MRSNIAINKVESTQKHEHNNKVATEIKTEAGTQASGYMRNVQTNSGLPKMIKDSPTKINQKISFSNNNMQHKTQADRENMSEETTKQSKEKEEPQVPVQSRKYHDTDKVKTTREPHQIIELQTKESKDIKTTSGSRQIKNHKQILIK